MRIVFVYPKWTDSYGITSYFAKRNLYPPMNLALLSAIAKKAGHETYIIDAEIEDLNALSVIKKIREINPDAVACTGKSPFFHLSSEICLRVKLFNQNIITIIGGPHITILKEKAFYEYFDYGVVGECENTFAQLLNRIQESSSVKDINGILYRDSKGIQLTGLNDHIQDLDSLPYPDRAGLKYKKYKLGTMQGRKNFTTIQTIRGCPWNCIFCKSEALGTNKIRKRDPRLVVDEIEHVIDTYGITHFMIIDDVLTMDAGHIRQLCYQLINRQLHITFEGSTRANLIDEYLVRLMQKAGLIRLSFGLESANANIREIINKKIPLECYSESNALLNKYEIEVLNSVMIGLPGETPETIEETLSFLVNDKNIKQANLAIAVPYPGTVFYDMVKNSEYGMKLVSEDFSQYRRYGNAVVEINGMTPQDLINFQNEGFVKIYSAPWRWLPLFRRQGLIGMLLTLKRLWSCK